MPLLRQTAMRSTSDGMSNQSGALPAVAFFMKCAHAGTATVPANPRFMIVFFSSWPNQTPATRLGVYPTNHASP